MATRPKHWKTTRRSGMHKERIDWFLEQFKDGLYINLNIDKWSVEARMLFKKMAEDGFYSKKTYWKDVTGGIVKSLHHAQRIWKNFK